jgi:hypothetical protein
MEMPMPRKILALLLLPFAAFAALMNDASGWFYDGWERLARK